MKDLLEENKNSNGGGLAINITGKFESNRHAIARLEKYTFGEVCKELKKKKNGGFNISASELLEIYTLVVGFPEWHHAGKLPKQYGGGMKKTYFLNEIPTQEQVNYWLSVYAEKKETQKSEQEKNQLKEIAKQKFIKKFGTAFNRVSELPKFSITTYTEMLGKHGWFIVESHHNYKLDIYYSGFSFKSKKTLEKFFSL